MNARTLTTWCVLAAVTLLFCGAAGSLHVHAAHAAHGSPAGAASAHHGHEHGAGDHDHPSPAPHQNEEPGGCSTCFLLQAADATPLDLVRAEVAPRPVARATATPRGLAPAVEFLRLPPGRGPPTRG